MPLDVDLVEHRVLRLPGNVRLHLHGHVPGEDGEEEPLLLLVLLLGGQPRLDALPGLHEGLPLGYLAGVVGEDPGDVGAEEEHGVAAHLSGNNSSCWFRIKVSVFYSETNQKHKLLLF